MNNKNRNLIIGGLIIALIIAVLAPFMASNNPDGLESSAKSLQAPESEPTYNAPLTDYAIPGMEDNPLGGVVSLLVGTIVVLILVLGVARLIGNRKKEKNGN